MFQVYNYLSLENEEERRRKKFVVYIYFNFVDLEEMKDIPGIFNFFLLKPSLSNSSSLHTMDLKSCSHGTQVIEDSWPHRPLRQSFIFIPRRQRRFTPPQSASKVSKLCEQVLAKKMPSQRTQLTRSWPRQMKKELIKIGHGPIKSKRSFIFKINWVCMFRHLNCIYSE